MNPQTPPLPKHLPLTVAEAFPDPHLKAADIPAGGITLKIDRVGWKWLRPQKDLELKAVVFFATLTGKACAKYLILNKTQATAIEAITNSANFSKWPGAPVQLAPARRGGKDTIAISHPAHPATADTPNGEAPTLTGEPEKF